MRFRPFYCAVAAALLLAASVFGQTDRERIASVTSALAGNDFDKALALLQPLLRQDPNDPKLWTLQGLALSGKTRGREALVAYDKALKLSPDYLPALEGAAQLEYNAGNQAGVPLLEHLLKLRPNDPTSHGMLAVLAYKKGDCPRALEHFSQSGPLLDTQTSAREEYVACLLKVGQGEKAVAYYQSFLAANPADADARFRLASIQLIANSPQGTLETLAPLLQQSSPDAKTLELAADAYEAAQNTPKAVETLRQAIVLDPHNVDLYVDFALVCMNHQSFQVGIDMVDVGLRAEPNAAPLYVARGVLYVQVAKYDDAEADFDKAEQLDPKQGVGSVAKGLEQSQANDLDKALATVRAKLATKPNDPYLLYVEADVLTKMGNAPGSPDFQNALRLAKKSVALNPSLVQARNLLAKLYVESEQYAAAVEQCRQVLKADPDDQTALYRLIQSLRNTGKTAELPELLKRLSELRAQSTKQERDANRYMLIETKTGTPTDAAPRP
jgi:tetratricopeptide (TPR) repeat protein